MSTLEPLEKIKILNGLKFGERYVYYTGWLPKDGSPNAFVVSKSAMALYEKGKVFLFQKRVAEFMYEYIAVGAV